MHLQAMKDYADPEKALRMAYKAFSIPFMLPVGSEVGSTTVVSIAIRNSKRYQVALEYYTLEEMRVMRWGPEAKKKPPDLGVVSELRYAMGWSGARTDKDWGAQAKQFLKDSLPGTEPSVEERMPELASVLGKKVAFSGSGRNRLVDRSLIRRIVHVSQGIPDDSLGQMVDQEGGGASQQKTVFETFCSFDHEEQLRVGKKTSPALKRITVQPAPRTLRARYLISKTSILNLEP